MASERRLALFCRRMMKAKALWIVSGIVFILWLNNTSLFVERSGGKPTIVAHAALGQTYDLSEVKWNGIPPISWTPSYDPAA